MPPPTPLQQRAAAAKALARAELASIGGGGGNVRVTSDRVRVWYAAGGADTEPLAVAIAFEYALLGADGSDGSDDSDCGSEEADENEERGVMVHIARRTPCAGRGRGAITTEQALGLRSMADAARLVTSADVFGEHAAELDL